MPVLPAQIDKTKVERKENVLNSFFWVGWGEGRGNQVLGIFITVVAAQQHFSKRLTSKRKKNTFFWRGRGGNVLGWKISFSQEQNGDSLVIYFVPFWVCVQMIFLTRFWFPPNVLNVAFCGTQFPTNMECIEPKRSARSFNKKNFANFSAP